MILVDEKECMALLKKHRFRDLKEMFSSGGMKCENCKNFEGRKYPICENAKDESKKDSFCRMWERKE